MHHQSPIDAPSRNCWKLLAPLLAVLVLGTACSPAGVRNQPPLVSVSAWRIDGENLQFALRIQNVNDEELPLAALDLNVRLKGVPLLDYAAPHDLVVAARGSETLRLEARASEAGMQLLDELQSGAAVSLPWSMNGVVRTADDHQLTVSQEGHLYPVPGRPGQFR